MTRLATEAELTLSSFFEAMRGKGAPRLREEAWERFSGRGLPNRRVESWHYTDLKSALRKPAPMAAGGGGEPSLRRAHDATRLVLLDGAFAPELSDIARLPDGVFAQSLAEALSQGETEIVEALAGADVGADDAIDSLNAALMWDGVVLRIAPGAIVERPIELASVLSGGAARSIYARSVALIGAGASATVIESHGASAAPSQVNQTLILRLAEKATLELATHVLGLIDEGVRVLSLLARLDEGATLNSFALVEGGGLLRRQIFARLAGERARVAFNGASLLRGRDHADTTLVVDHTQPHGESRERFRTIVDEQSVGVFQGKVVVRPGAQKTDGAMQSKALLLSDAATMNYKPELEIFADDVQCGHGATCGRLDADQLFYLMARGLSRPEAEMLLIEGFANETLETLEDDDLRGFFSGQIATWLSRRMKR